MGKGVAYSETQQRIDRRERLLHLRELAAYNRARAEELEAEAAELIADDVREYVDSAELITIEA